MDVIPAIDLKEGHCVRLNQGRREDVKVYDDDPIELAHRFVTAGARMIHVVDIDGALTGQTSANRAIARRIAAQGISVQFGGGVRKADDVKHLLDLGIARVVLGTVAVDEPAKLTELAQLFGARVCVGIDARNDRVAIRGWEQETRIEAVELARKAASAGIERIIFTDIARDGMLGGVNVDATVAIARASGLRVTASGGVASIEDIRRLTRAGEPLVDSVIIGRALYENRFTLETALEVANQT